MNSQPSFDFAKPFDIMVGHWVGTSSIYNPAGTYLLSTKSYVSVYWNADGTLSFRESAEDDMEYSGQAAKDFVNPRTADGVKEIANLLSGSASKKMRTVSNSSALRSLTYDFVVTGSYCETPTNAPVSVTGRQTRPDSYQFHVKKRKEIKDKDGKVVDWYFHHVFNSHHMPSPDDWHIIGPIVGPVWKRDAQGKEMVGEVDDAGDERVGLSVVQFFRRISYSVPAGFVSKFI
jgi:hypothetical protein